RYTQAAAEAKRQGQVAAEERRLGQILDQDPQDGGTLERFLTAAASLGDVEVAHERVKKALVGREKQPQVLLAFAKVCGNASLYDEAVELLRRAHAAEADPDKKQEILFTLGEMYANAQQSQNARAVFQQLASEGGNQGIRDRAMGRLA